MSCENKTYKITNRMILFFKRFLHVCLIHESKYKNKELFEVLELSNEDFEKSENDPKYKYVHKRMKNSLVEWDDDVYKLGFNRFGKFSCEVKYEKEYDEDDHDNWWWVISIEITLRTESRKIEIFSLERDFSERCELIDELDGLKRGEIVLCKYCDEHFTTNGIESFIDGSCDNCYISSTYGTENCCICLSNDQIEPWIKLVGERGCKHSMHMRCAKTLDKCPICRAEIDSFFLNRPFCEFEEDIV